MSDTLFYEDLEVGRVLVSPAHVVDEAELVQFARTWDPLPAHIDKAAGERDFGSLTAPGLYMLALKQRLIHQMARHEVIASFGYDEVRFLNPVRPGQTVRVHEEVISKRESGSKPDRGIVTLRFSLKNEQGEVALTHLDTVLVRRRDRAF